VSFCGAATMARTEDNPAKAKAQAFFDGARALSDLRVDGSPPFRLEAVINVNFGNGVRPGNYVLTWQSKNRWRDEVTFPRYHQVRVGGEDVVWVWRNTNHQSAAVLLFLRGLNLDLRSEIPKGRQESISERQTREATLLIEPPARHPATPDLEARINVQSDTPGRENRFESQAGLLTRQVWDDWGTIWDYALSSVWNGKQYPEIMHITQGSREIADARITSLEAASRVAPETFLPPHGAEAWPRCENPNPPTFKSPEWRRALPSGPASDRTPVLIEVGTDGTVEDAVFMHPMADRMREQRLAVMLKQHWRFEPATCGEVAIPFSLVADLPI
jgi:hypothetical protein